MMRGKTTTDRIEHGHEAVRRYAGSAINRRFLARVAGFQPVHEQLPGELDALMTQLDRLSGPAARSRAPRRS